jgi:hypothetical protein
MLRLLASAPEDGWAFVEDGENLVVIRPPYTVWSRAKTQRDALGTAIQLHGFRTEDRDFPDWAALTVHLKEQIIESRRARGDEEPTSESIRKLFHFAPRYILVEYLDRIESELLPCREWSAAATILSELLRVDSVKTDTVLLERTVDLLNRCQEERTRYAESRRKLMALGQNLSRFERSWESWGEPLAQYIEQITTRRQSLMVGR